MPLNETSGNLTTDAFGGGVAVVPAYIEDVFSTWLYTGTNGTPQTITNNIDLSTKGGLTWIKSRSAATDHKLTDTVRGATKALISNSTAAQTTDTTGLTAFGTTGFTIGADSNYNNNATTYASWTFRKQPKFFDVITWTGDGVDNRSISHNLGSVPGFVIVKDINSATNWYTFHRSQNNASPGPQGYIRLNATSPVQDAPDVYVDLVNSTSSTLLMGPAYLTNANGANYVAYLFAHNAGGFGATGTDNVISCGGVTPGAGGISVNLGYEPQFVMLKQANGADSWYMVDTMRGFTSSPVGASIVIANGANAETINSINLNVNSTGFSWSDLTYGSWIYIAIRRGPMKVPTDATTVYGANTASNLNTAYSATSPWTCGFTPDILMFRLTDFDAGIAGITGSRLQGNDLAMFTNTTDVQQTGWGTQWSVMNGVWFNVGVTSHPVVGWFFKRAPSFMDVVICTQTGSAQNVNHNLGVAPELLILKDRTSAVAWQVGTQFTSTTWNNLVLNTNDAGSVGAYNNYINAQPTSTVFRLGPNLGSTNDSFVAYLFATCPGVSKVGSYTGNGTTQTIDCGFTGGARFVLIKRTDSTGNWYVYDTTRGMTVLTDPYLLLNSSATQTATLGSVTTVSTGFALNSTILAAINVSSATYIFLAIA